MDYLANPTSLSPIRRGFAPGFVNYIKGALDSQLQVIKFTSCLHMVGGSLRLLRFLPPLKLVTMILLKVALNTKKKIKSIIMHVLSWTVDMFLKKILPLAMVWMHVTSKKKKNYLRELNIPLFLFHCSLYYSIYYTTELFQHNSGKLNIFSIIQGLIALQNQYMIDTCRNIDILKQLINNSTKYALYIQHSSRKDIRFSRFTCTYQYIKHQNELSSIASQYTK